MKKHLIVFLAYQHPEIVHNSFESILKKDSADLFVIENPSDKTEIIKEYFSQYLDNEWLKGYIVFDENVANSAINIFLKDYKELLSEYQYITITDGDLFVYNIEDTFLEIFEGLELPDVVVSTCDLWGGNDYRNGNPLGVEQYVHESYTIKHNSDKKRQCVVGHTGNFLLTVKNENLSIFDNIIYVDSYIAQEVSQRGKLWVHTTKNLAYHETWDLYRDGNPYFEYKKQVFDKIWFKEQFSNYKKIK